MQFSKQCLLCLVGVLVLETVVGRGSDSKPAVRIALRKAASHKAAFGNAVSGKASDSEDLWTFFTHTDNTVSFACF